MKKGIFRDVRNKYKQEMGDGVEAVTFLRLARRAAAKRFVDKAHR